MLLALDYGEPFWTDPCDEENFIPAVVHVYCLDDEGRCWDVRGARSETIAASEIADWLPNVTDTILEMVADEEELRTYVGCWGEDAEGNQIERPLREYDEDDLEQALLDVKLALRNTTGFPAFDVALRIVGGFR